MNLSIIDAELTLFINHLHTPWWNDFFYFYTQEWMWIPLYLLFGFFRLKYDRKEGIIIILMTLVVVGTANWFSSEVCKPFFQRLRPTHNPELKDLVLCVKEYRGGLYGFISSHASNCFSVAVFLSLVFRRKGLTLMLFVWASLNAYSRVYLGVHFVGDILCGTLAGVCIAYAYYVYFEKYSLRHPEKVKLPRTISEEEERVLIGTYGILCFVCMLIATIS